MPSSNREFWQRKFEDNVSRDERNLALLEAMGWVAVEVWECELEKGGVEAAAARIKSWLPNG